MTKKVRINKAIFGKKVFNSRVELEFYRRYKTMKLDKRIGVRCTSSSRKSRRIYPCETAEEEIEAWQYLIDTGVAWQLQGWFGRQADFLIKNKLCTAKVVN